MENAIIVTVGEINNFQFHTFIVRDVETAKKMAADFVKVIPDDPDDYLADIKEWNGREPFTITHQDDDSFYFSATPTSGVYVEEDSDMTDFNKFVSEYAYPDDEG